jgi:putative nucleotidyltransferase with HDIG domain
MLVKVESLSSGMILDQDVTSDNGALLIPKGRVLNEQIIMKLLEMGIFNVLVKDNWVNEEEFIAFDKIYSEEVQKVKDTFKYVKYKQAVKISEFESIVEDLLNRTEMSKNMLLYMKLIERKDEYTFQHSINVSISSMLMGKWIGYSHEDIKLLGVAAVLHDVGKVMIPGEILNKPDKLTNMEFSIIKNHTKLGFRLLSNSGNINEAIKNVALTHHERLNGGGYPFGIIGHISEMTRIVSICDVYDAVTSQRVYRDKANPLDGLKIIFDNSYSGLDPFLCKIFLNNVSLAFRGSNAVLKDGSIGKIINIPPESPQKPWIAVNNSLYDLGKRSDMEIIDIL